MTTINAIDAEVNAASAALKAFPKGPTGITPDAVKCSPEYQTAKRRYQVAFAALRSSNAANRNAARS